jgi:hypothetical protein
MGPFDGEPTGLSRYVAADGTTYLVTLTRTEVNNRTHYTTVMTIIDPDGQVHTASVPRVPDFGPGQNVIVGADGTLYQLTVDGGTRQNYVATLSPDGTSHVGTPLPGDDPGYQALVKAPDGTVYVTSTVQGPAGVGGVTRVAIVSPDGGVTLGAPLDGQALSGVVVGPDGKLYQATNQGLYVLDTSSWVARHAPEERGYTVDPGVAVDGTVTGSAVAIDLDADTLTYERDPASGVMVDVQPDGTWTFTPTAQQRNAAFYGTGPSEVTFTVIATDGTYRTPVTVVAPIDPDAGDSIVLPAGAAPAASLIIGADGTAYQRSYNQAANASYLTVVRTDGTSYTSDPIPGGTIDGPIAAPDGTLYQLSWDSVANKTYVTVVDPQGRTSSTQVPGSIINPLVAGPGGTVYQTSFTGQSSGGGLGGGLGGSGGGAGGSDGGAGGSDGGGGSQHIDTYVTIAGPDGVHTSAPIPGQLQGPIAVDDNGFAYVTTRDGSQSYVTVVNSSSGVVGEPQLLSGQAVGRPVVGSSGTAFQTTYDLDDGSTYVVTIRSDGTVQRGQALPAAPISIPVVRSDGTVFQTTYDSDHTYVSVLAPDGTLLSTTTFAGTTGYGPTVGADGTVYQTYYTGHPVPGDTAHFEYQTSVVIIATDGSQHEIDGITGLVNDGGVHFGDDGLGYLITDTQTTGVNATHLTTFDSAGNIVNSAELEGLPVYGSYHAGSNGALYVATYKVVPSSADPQETYINYIHADGVVDRYTIHRAADFNGGTVVDPSGTVYQLTTDNGTDQTYVTTVDADGSVHNSDPVPGRPNGPALAVASDGTVYVTTTVNDHAAGQTYVTVIDPDGTVHVGEPIDGFSSGPVVFDSHQTAYQSTSVGTVLVSV